MSTNTTCSFSLFNAATTALFKEEELNNNSIYIVVLHATRIPPHIGLVINQHYHSLTVKGHDIDIPVKALIRNIEQRSIPSLFIRIKPHATFSPSYLREHFILNIQEFPKVEKGLATCLSPINTFFNEVYNIPTENAHFLFKLLPILQQEGLIETIASLFIDATNYQLPTYTQEQLDKEIENVHQEISRIKQLSKSF